MSIPDMLDKFVLSYKTYLPTKSRDHNEVIKNASRGLSLFSSNLDRLMRENPDVTKTALAKMIGVDPKTITRILTKSNEPSLETISAIAKVYGKTPWEMLHPDLGHVEVIDLTPEKAVAVIAHILVGLPGPRQEQIADRLRTLALAPDSMMAKEALLRALASDDRAEPEMLGAPIAPDKLETLENLSRQAEEIHEKRIRKRQAT